MYPVINGSSGVPGVLPSAPSAPVNGQLQPPYPMNDGGTNELAMLQLLFEFRES